MRRHLLLGSLPNLITIGRLLAVPLMVWLILSGELTGAFWLFVVAGISDGVDGFIAKRYGAETVLGAYLDPIADKVMLVCVYVTLSMEGHIALWLVILVVFRDVLIVGGTMLSAIVDRPVRMKPLYISKVNTVAQIVLAAVVLAQLGLELSEIRLVDVLEYVVAATTLVSGALYLVQWITGKGAFLENQAPIGETGDDASRQGGERGRRV